MSPLDTYHCRECGYVTDVFRREDVPRCPVCESSLKKKFPLFRINVSTDEHKARDSEEKAHQLQYEADEKEHAAEVAEIKKGDDDWHRKFAHVLNSRSTERLRYLDSEGDTRRNLELKGKTGIR